MSMRLLAVVAEIKAELARLAARIERLEAEKPVPAIQRPVGRPPKEKHGDK